MTRDQEQPSATPPQPGATPSQQTSAPDLNHNSHSSHNSQDSHPTAPAPATASSLPILAESQDNFELLFDPAIPFDVHTKRRSPLDRLPPEHQQAIINLIREHPLQTVADLLARPLPYGVNLQTTPTALSRFSHRYIAARDKREREQKILTAQEIMCKDGDPTAVFNQLSSQILQSRILATSSESDPDLNDLHTLINCLTKLRRQSLAERSP